MGYDVFQFGVLNLDGKIQSVPQYPTGGGDIPQYDGKAAISLGTSEPGEGITWIKPNGSNLLIADRVLLSSVSWKDLDKNGFTVGKTIRVDGQHFRCRLLQVGEDRDIPNEWDKALDETGEDNSLWHWEDMFFWGANTSAKYAAPCAVRGYHSARYWYYYHAASRNVAVGFRPALEPLGADDPFSNCTLDGEDFQLSKIPGNYGFCPVLRPYQENVFAGIPDGSNIKMYTAIQDGHPIQFTDKVKSLSGITLTDQYFGDEFLIPWVISNGVAVASQSLKPQIQHTKAES